MLQTKQGRRRIKIVSLQVEPLKQGTEQTNTHSERPGGASIIEPTTRVDCRGQLMCECN